MSQQGLLHIQSDLYLLASQHNHMTSQGYFCGLLHLLFWFFWDSTCSPQQPLVCIPFIEPSTTITSHQVDDGVDVRATKIILETQICSCSGNAVLHCTSVISSCQHFCRDLSSTPGNRVSCQQCLQS